jgi:hypothetical protein
MKTTLMTLTLAATLGLATALPADVTTQESRPREEMVLKTLPADISGTEQTAVATVDDYARRESQAKDLESFTGGRHEDVIIVSAGAVALVILILILI